ncbi:MAG: YtxH domain-containing protein [Anaerolineae bacterium]|nr:YtxH domain-containing protein [Anaerolineae bacterium]
MTEPTNLEPDAAVVDEAPSVPAAPAPGLPWGAFWFGLAVGWLVGVVIGILRAPRSGEQTIAMLAEQGGEIALQVQKQIRRDPVQEAIEEGKEIAQERLAGRKAEPDAE